MLTFHVTVANEALTPPAEHSFSFLADEVQQARRLALVSAVEHHGSGDWKVYRVWDDGGRFAGLEDRDVSVLLAALRDSDCDFYAMGLHTASVRLLADLEREDARRIVAARREALSAEAPVASDGTARTVSVEWDTKTDDDLPAPQLPSTVEVPGDIDAEQVADWLSDQFGFCVLGWAESSQ